MTDTRRRELAGRQAAFLAALVAEGPVPAGFDPARVAAEARALHRKRRRVLARIVTAMLDAASRPVPSDLDDRLDAWLAGRPHRTGTGFHDQAHAFVATLPGPRRRRWRR
ncbi:hypothetical protein [Actinomycetospora soli]|uniref:hypothetical protein n=1 Tax=Actinomycetospora soli TaxID=2893887 RepID=UPI001E488CFB|nr:hypothetical protein [Actinomycetospora soli]MCD2190892.1 hypothetical protein [Actinomycetospora soli]